MPTKRALCAAALLPLLSACTLLEPSEEHTTLEDAPEALEVPTSVTSVGWDWQPPDNTGITHVSPTQHGVAAMVDDGVVSLAGDTGEEHWHYRRPEEPITSAAVTPDGSKVMLSYAGEHTDEEDGDDPPAQNEIVLLDAATGDIINEHTADFQPPDQGSLGQDIYHDGLNPGIITDNARVTQEVHDGTYGDIVADSLENGEELWNTTPEPPSDLPDESEGVVELGLLSDDTLLLSVLFSSPDSVTSPTQEDPNDYALTLLAIDQNDGSELWRHDTTLLDYADVPRHQMGVNESTGTFFVFSRLNDDAGDREWTLDAETGETVSDVGFISERDEDIVGPIGNEVVMVNRSETEEGDELEYTYENLPGEVQDTVTTEAPLGRIVETGFIVPLPEGLAWLDVNHYDESAAEIVVTDRNDGTSQTLDLGGLSISEHPGNDGTPLSSPFPNPSYMTLTPGALVISGTKETENGARSELVGVVP